MAELIEGFMNLSLITKIMLVFSILAALDRIIGNKFGLGKEFERGFMLMGVMMLTMTGMIIISPLLSKMLEPCFSGIYNLFGIDPSVIPASLFANDMGGAPLSRDVAMNPEVGMFNALITSSMMGATISYTIPFSLGTVKKEQHKELIVGLLCGIVTIPIGCFIGGLMCRINILTLLLNILPLVIFSLLIALGLFFFPDLSVKVFSWVGKIITAIITVGLVLGGIEFLTKAKITDSLVSIEEGTYVCMNASIVMSGAFPLIYVISKILRKPMEKLGEKMGINSDSAIGFVSTLATNVTTLGNMEKMDKKGAVLNSAFLVSAAFTFAGHLAFTLAFDESYIYPMIAGKVTAGITAVFVAMVIYKRIYEKEL